VGGIIQQTIVRFLERTPSSVHWIKSEPWCKKTRQFYPAKHEGARVQEVGRLWEVKNLRQVLILATAWRLDHWLASSFVY